MGQDRSAMWPYYPKLQRSYFSAQPPLVPSAAGRLASIGTKIMLKYEVVTLYPVHVEFSKPIIN